MKWRIIFSYGEMPYHPRFWLIQRYAKLTSRALGVLPDFAALPKGTVEIADARCCCTNAFQLLLRIIPLSHRFHGMPADIAVLSIIAVAPQASLTQCADSAQPVARTAAVMRASAIAADFSYSILSLINHADPMAAKPVPIGVRHGLPEYYILYIL